MTTQHQGTKYQAWRLEPKATPFSQASGIRAYELLYPLGELRDSRDEAVDDLRYFYNTPNSVSHGDYVDGILENPHLKLGERDSAKKKPS